MLQTPDASGWSRVGHELAAALPRGTTFVIDTAAVSDHSPAAGVLAAFTSASTGSMRAVLVGPGRPPPHIAAAVIGRHQLAGGREAVRQAGRPLPPDTLARLVRLTHRRPVLLHDALVAADHHGEGLVADAVAASRHWRGLARRLTHWLLEQAGPDEIEALAVAVDLGYWCAALSLGSAPPELSALRPWLVPLEGEWFRLRPMWAGPLRRRLGAVQRSPRSAARPRRSASPVPAHPPVNGHCGVPAVPASGPDGAPAAHRLDARLLGGFELAIDGARIDAWNGQRGLAVLKYLLVRRKDPCPRDLVTDVFWPDVPAAQARNRLHVALSALRQTLRTVVDVPVVEHRNGSYRLNPQLEVVLDVDELDRGEAAGREAEARGNSEAAAAAYERAVGAYRGDLLIDTPYDDWLVLPREALRSRYLDLLDRLTTIYSASDRTSDCIRVARLILLQDDCREDVHRLLMRCYVSQGRVREALRQFEVCREALRAALGTAPSATTARLADDLRRRATR